MAKKTKETNVNEEVVTTIDIQKEKIRQLVSGVYDIQKLRVATGNRIVQAFNIQMGQAPSTKQEDMEKEAQKTIDVLRKEYKLITDAYIDNKSSINKIIEKAGNENLKLIRTELDYKLVKSYEELLDSEETMLSTLSKEVEKHPMWNKFFKDVKGCGPLMAAVCLGYFDIEKARHVSSFWKYAGLDTVTLMKDDGTVVTEGRAAKHAKYNEIEYVDKNGETKTKTGLGYNPIVKTKLVGVLGSCLLKAGLRSTKDEKGKVMLDADGNKIRSALSNAKYVQIYLDYYNRLNQRPDTKEYPDAHKHNMANRYMIKMFLRDLWTIWREDAGYEVTEPYEVAKLGMKPHKYNEAQCEANKRTSKAKSA